MTTPEDHATLKAYIVGVDTAARAAERTWGMDRLPMLADAEMRVRFFRQQAKWRQALETAYEAPSVSLAMMDQVRASSAAMERAWGAMGRSAVEAGHKPIAPDIWECALKDGRLVAIVQTAAEAGAVIADGRHVAVYTTDEIGNLIDALPQLLTHAKEVFVGAEIVTNPKRDRTWMREGDALPFG